MWLTVCSFLMTGTVGTVRWVPTDILLLYGPADIISMTRNNGRLLRIFLRTGVFIIREIP